jgi:tRNA modification GTPase
VPAAGGQEGAGAHGQSRDGAQVNVCAASGAGIDALRQHLKDCSGFQPSGEDALTARTRHVEALRGARDHVETAARLLAERHAGELVAQELRDAHRCLGEITGEVTSEDLLGKIFGSFCIGK